MFEAAVAMSRKWDAGEAGEEIGKQITEKMKNKPKFVLLFSTIHYEKWGGFQKFLDAVNIQLPKDTPVIGGTVAGFMNNYGCYTRGASALAVYSDEMDLAVGVGHNTKRNPKKAGLDCLKSLTTIKNSKYSQKIIIDFVSGVTMPKFPFMERVVVIRNHNRVVGELINLLLVSSTIVFQKGIAREEEVLQPIVDVLSNSYIFGGGNEDDNNFRNNYQFYNGSVFENSITALGISFNQSIRLKSGHGYYPIGEPIKNVKKRVWNRTILEMDGKPATKKYMEALGWSDDLLDDVRQFHRRFMFNPIGGFDESNKVYPAVLGAYLGSNYGTGCPVPGNKVTLLRTSGLRQINIIDDILPCTNPKFAFFIGCGNILETLGSQLYKLKEKIDQRMTTPYLMVFTAGEHNRIPGQPIRNYQSTLNVLSIE